MLFKVEFEVRDNELDVQGIVSNIVYPAYMAHARHKFLKEILNMDFIKFSQKKQNLILTSSNIEFKRPLKAYDKFYVTCKIIPESKLRFIFEQEIRLIVDDSLVAIGLHRGVCVDGNNKNKPYVPKFLTQALESI